MAGRLAVVFRAANQVGERGGGGRGEGVQRGGVSAGGPDGGAEGRAGRPQAAAAAEDGLENTPGFTDTVVTGQTGKSKMSGCTIQYKHLYGLKPISIYILKPSNMNVLCSNADCVCGGLCLNDIHAMKIW